MINIGITGQSGFIGSHLYNSIKLYPKDFKCINFTKTYFKNKKKLDLFVSKCDVIIHLAGINRHKNQDKIYNTNLLLTNKMIESFDRLKKAPHILISSSLQEKDNNHYGKSKFEILGFWGTNWNTY